MKSEYIKYPEEREMLMGLLNNASEASRTFLKNEVYDNIISLLTLEKEKTDGFKWERLYRLQKRIDLIKYDLGEAEANVLIQEVVDTLSEYINKNKNFREEAFYNAEILSNIQKEKVRIMEHNFSMEDE